MKAAFTLSQSKTKSLTALFLAMVLMLLAPSMMRGQTVTVCDGTATNSYVPMYTYYCDYSFTSEYIIPQSQLSNLPSGSAITAITLYQNSGAAWVAKSLTIKLTNTTTTYYSSSGLLGSSGTTVYTNSSYSANSASSHTFTFNGDAFTYTGGSLIVQISAASGGTYKSSSWYGVSQSTSQGYYVYGSSSSSGSLQSFIPKTTFTYTAGGSSSSCTPSFSNTTDYIASFSLGNINNANSGFSTGGYGNFTSQSTNLSQGASISASLTSSSGSGTHAAAVWIDFNDNGTFESSERVGTQGSIGASATVNISLSIPSNAATGSHRLRVVYQYSVEATNIDPCASASWGEGEDYTVNITASTCTPSLSGYSSYYMTNFTTTGGASNINQSYNSAPSSSYTNLYNSVSLTAVANSTVSFTATTVGTGTYGCAIWIDFNKDGDFTDSGERVYVSSGYVDNPSGSFSIPSGIEAGDYRMRVMVDWSNTAPSNPCSGSNGEAKDYKLTVVVITTPTVTTGSYSNLSTTSVTLGGTITNMGGASSVTAGICLGTTNPPTTSNTHQESSYTGTGGYTKTFTGLTAGTKYYFRAFAYNSANSLSNPSYGSSTYYIVTDNTISYTLNGGTVSSANPTSYNPEFKSGELPATLNNPTKSGCIFTGWTGSNGSTPQTTVTITSSNSGNLNYTANFASLPSPIVMTCGTNYTGTLGTSGLISNYTNGSWTEPGEEKIYAYTPPVSGSYTFTGNSSSGDADFFLMESYSNTGNSLGCWSEGTASYTLTAGHTYYLFADNYSSSNTASYTVAVSCPKFALTTNSSPSAGGSISGNNGPYEEGETCTLTANPASGYRFTGWTISGTGATLSSAATNPTTFTMGSANATVTANFIACPVNYTCATATSLPCGTSNLSGTTVGTPGDPHGLPSSANVSNYGVWYTFTGTGGSTTISVSASGYDTEIDIVSGSCGNFTWIGYNDSGSSTTSNDTYTFTTQVGVTYYVYVAHYSSTGTTTGTFTISRTCVAPTSAPMTTMTCGQTYQGTVGNSYNTWTSYTGCSWTESGEEHIYAYTPPVDGNYTFRATEDGDPDFFLTTSIATGQTLTTLTSNWSQGNKTVSLTAGTTYYLIVDNCDDYPSNYTVTVDCPRFDLITNSEPSAGGTVSGNSGNYGQGETCELSAIPSDGYFFTGWTIEGNGSTLSSTTTNPTTFTMGLGDATVTANFTAWSIDVVTTPSSTECIEQGTEVSITASVDVPNEYLFSATSATFNSIASDYDGYTTTGGDGTTLTVPLDFAFNLAGKDFTSGTSLTMRCDGFVTFGSAWNTNTPSSPGTIHDVISALGYDQNLNNGESYMYYKVTGAEGSRVLTMEWKNMRSYYSAYNWTNYQVKLYEGSNIVELCYGSFTYNYTSTQTYTYISADGRLTQIASSYVYPVVQTNTTGSPTTISVGTASAAPTNGTVYRFTPPISYAWAYTGSEGMAIGDTYTVSPTQNSTYTVSATYNGFTKSENVNVTVAPATPTNLQVTNIGLITATASWSGSASSYKWRIDGSAWYTTSNTSVSLTGLTPGGTYTFQVKAVGNGTCESSVASTTFTTQSTHTLSASVNPANSGTISDGNGNISGNVTYNHGTSVSLTATAATGYTFQNWTVDGSTVSGNPTSITMNADHTVTANFQHNSYAITATASPAAGGTVSGDGTHNYGAAATLSATPSTGYHFVNWTENGDEVSTDAAYSFTVTGARDLVANFTPDTYTITATANPTAGGTITGAGTYNYDATATLTATANTGYHFVNWTENGSQVGTAGNTTYTISNIQANHDITANFERNTMTLTAEGDTWTYNGQAHTATVTPEVTAGTTLYYRITPNDQWSTNVPSIINVGTLHVYVKATNANYADSYADCILEVTPKAVTITVTDAEKTYGAAEPTFTGSVEGLINNSDLGTITYYRTNEDENVGTYEDVITADYTPNSNYSVTVVPGDFTINQAKIDIVVTGNTSTDTYDAEEHSVSGYILACESDLFDAENVLFDGNDIAIGTNAGTYMMELDAEQFSYDDDNINATFTIAEDGKLTINQASITITVTGSTATETYNGEEQSVSGYELACTSDLFNEENVAFSGDATASGTDAGTYMMELAAEQFSYDDDNINATFSVTDGMLTITPASVTVNIVGNYNTEDYDGEEHTVSGYTISSIMMGEEETELYTEDDFTYSGDSMVSSTNAGTTYMGLSAEDFENTNENFDEVTFNIVSDGYITINPISAVVTITGRVDTVTYDGTEHTVTGYTATANTDLYDVEEDIEFSGEATASQTIVGTNYMGLTAEQFENTNENFEEVTFNIVTDGHITVNPVGVVVTIVGHTEEADYDGNAHTVNGYDVTSITIGNEPTQLYTANDFTFNGTASASRTNVVEGEDADGTTDMGLTPDMFTNTNTNFTDVTFNVTDGSITINPITATVNITGNYSSDAYDGEEHEVNGYEVTSIMIGEEETELYTTNDFTFTGTASASRTNVVEGEDADGTTNMGLTADMFANINTNFTDVTFNVTDGYQTITPITATVTIVGNHDIKDFDGEEHAVNDYEVTSIMVGEEETELYTEDDFTFSGTASAARTDAGTTNMNLTEGQFTNNNTNFSTVTFEITDGYITVNAVDAIVTIVGSVDTVTYDGTEHTVTHYTATANTDLYDVEEDFTFTPGETSTIVEDEIAATRTDVGTTYMGLTAEQFENTNENFANVTFNVTDGHITVNPAAITIIADENGKVYGAAEPTTLTATVEGVPESGVDPVYTVSRAEGEDVGEYPITVTPSADANPNYTITIVGGVFTITPATVTVTADNKSKVYGTEDPDLTWTAEGFQNNDNEEMLTVSISRAEGNYVGDYTITPSGDAVQGNYNVEYVDGTFSILPTVVFTTDPMPTAICSEGSISVAFDATIAGENGTMSFAWSRNHTDDVTGTAEGTGNIEDLTLTTSATQTVTFSVIPTFTPTEGEAVTGDAVTFNVAVNALPAVTASHENVSCTELGSATLTVTNGDAPLSCLWNNNETVSLTADGNNYSVTFDELTEGDYTYAITNANNCVTEGTVSVSDPGRVTVSQSANSETCVNVGITVSYEIEGGTDPYTLTWMNADNDIPVEETEVNSTTGTHNFTLPEGEHRLALVITDHYGCSSTSDDIITVTVWPTQYIVRDIDLVGTQTTYVVNGITYDVNGEGPADQTYPDVHGCDSTIHYVINQYTLGISIADRCTMTQSSYTRTYSNTPHILYGDTIYVQKNNPATFYAYINDTQETQWNDEKMDMSYELLFNESAITDSDLPSLVSNFSISSYYDRTGQYYGINDLTAATGEIPNNTLAFRQTANSTILHFDYFYFAAFKNIPNKVTLTGLENGTYTLKLKAELRHSTGGTNRTGIYNPYIVGRKYGHLWGGYNDRPGNREVIAARTFTIIVNETGTNPNGAPMAVNEYAEGASVMAFPNPVNDQLNLRISGMSGAAVITITDAQGKVVRTLNTELYGGEEVLTYSVADFAQGMYFINVRNSDTLVSEKFVVTRR